LECTCGADILKIVSNLTNQPVVSTKPVAPYIELTYITNHNPLWDRNGDKIISKSTLKYTSGNPIMDSPSWFYILNSSV